MSAATDALREALEGLDIDSVESEMDELRNALDAARTALKDAATEVRAALAKVQEVGAAVRALFNGQDDGEVVPESAITGLLDQLGGPDSSVYGALDDMDSSADSLESAADDVTTALGDGEEAKPAAPASTACLHQAPAGEEEPPEGAVCVCAGCVAARAKAGVP
jgi:hypothetical protein